MLLKEVYKTQRSSTYPRKQVVLKNMPTYQSLPDNLKLVSGSDLRHQDSFKVLPDDSNEQQKL